MCLVHVLVTKNSYEENVFVLFFQSFVSLNGACEEQTAFM